MRFNPLDHPIIFAQPQRLTISSWIELLPFGMYMVEQLQPATLVELGTHYGVSYCGFCQAVETLGLETRCYAVDNWKGDGHTGGYEEAVYEDLRQYHDPRYGHFSRLMRMNFDDALPSFRDGSIDLLHIDGFHTYDAVRHDFETWLPKLSERGVVLFHDVYERDREFEVWRFWDEIKARYPTFDLPHEHGLGVAAVGAQSASLLADLLAAAPDERELIRTFFDTVGAHITGRMRREEFDSRLQHVLNLTELVSAREAEIANAKIYIRSLEEALGHDPTGEG